MLFFCVKQQKRRFFSPNPAALSGSFWQLFSFPSSAPGDRQPDHSRAERSSETKMCRKNIKSVFGETFLARWVSLALRSPPGEGKRKEKINASNTKKNVQTDAKAKSWCFFFLCMALGAPEGQGGKGPLSFFSSVRVFFQAYSDCVGELLAKQAHAHSSF